LKEELELPKNKSAENSGHYLSTNCPAAGQLIDI